MQVTQVENGSGVRRSSVEKAAGMRRTEATAVLRKMRTGSTYDYLPIQPMKVDHRFQRLLRKVWVKRHVALFDANQIGAIVVSRRKDGSLWIIDGQHRVELLRAVGWGDQSIFCEIFDDITLQEEAALFLARNDKISPRAFDEFRARLTKGDEDALAIQRIVQMLDLKITEGQAEGSVSAVRALEYVYIGARIASKKEGAIALGKTLRSLITAWGKSASNFNGVVIEGIGRVWLTYGGKIDERNLVDKLARVNNGATGLQQAGKTWKASVGGDLTKAVAAVVVQRYNRGLRARKLDRLSA